MGYAAAALAILGLAMGLAFRFKVLLLVLLLLIIPSAVFAIGQGWNSLYALLTIMAVQTIVQTGYFVGVLVRSFVTDKLRVRALL